MTFHVFSHIFRIMVTSFVLIALSCNSDDSSDVSQSIAESKHISESVNWVLKSPVPEGIDVQGLQQYLDTQIIMINALARISNLYDPISPEGFTGVASYIHEGHLTFGSKLGEGGLDSEIGVDTGKDKSSVSLGAKGKFKSVDLSIAFVLKYGSFADGRDPNSSPSANPQKVTVRRAQVEKKIPNPLL